MPAIFHSPLKIRLPPSIHKHPLLLSTATFEQDGQDKIGHDSETTVNPFVLLAGKLGKQE